jgi:Family of unknown function (DUF6049)
VSAARRGLRVALALVVLVLVVPPGTAHAQQTAPPDVPVGVHLVQQDPWVRAGGEFTMLLGIDDRRLVGRPDAALAISVHQRTRTRSSFDEVIANGHPGSGLYTLPLIPVALLPDFGGNLVVTLGLAGSHAGTTIGIADPGVYPVEVSLTNTGVATGSFITWLVVVSNSERPVDEPLMVSSIWPVTAPPARLPDGSVDPAVVEQMSRGGRLDRIATLLRRTAGTPISLSVGPETMKTWSKVAAENDGAAAGFDRVRNAARRTTTELLPTPYVPADLPALEFNGFGDKVPDLLTQGNETMQDVVGAAPSDKSQTMFLDPADDAATDRVRGLAITRLAVRDSALETVTHRYSPAQAFPLTTNAGRSLAVATAPFVENLLTGDDPPALKSQRVIAALAEIAYEYPSIPRGVVLAPPTDWRPELDAYTTLFDALRTFPLATPVTLDTLFTRISREEDENGADVERRFVPTVPPVTPLTRSEWDAAQRELDAYRGVAPTDDPVVARSDEALLRALSTGITGEQAQAELAPVYGAVKDFTSRITVDAKRVTLTSRRANVPITFENTLNRTVRVRVHLESEKLLFPNGADVEVNLPPGRTTLRDEFLVEARTSGTFPLDIGLTTVDGALSFGDTRVTVRSAVFGGFAIALTVGALVFLAGWWANHLRRTRRARRQAAPALT